MADTIDEFRIVANELLDTLKHPIIWLETLGHSEDAPSRLGGLPALPKNLKWPENNATGQALHFIAQLDLSELPQTPLSDSVDQDYKLPQEGMLFFFFDIDQGLDNQLYEDRTTRSRVLYAKKQGTPREPPDDTPGFGHVPGAIESGWGYKGNQTAFTGMAVQAHTVDADAIYHSEWSKFNGRFLTGHLREGRLPLDSKFNIELQKIEKARFKSNLETLIGAKLKDDEIIRHVLLAPFVASQGIRDRPDGAIPLLQIATDFRVDEMFQFAYGEIQFFISPSDLAAGSFENAWAEAVYT